jgi:protein disulfide-isomerase A4
VSRCRFDIQQFPTLKVFRNGTAYDFEGNLTREGAWNRPLVSGRGRAGVAMRVHASHPRIRAGIIAYMREQADPAWRPPADPVIPLTQSNFYEVVNSQDFIAVEFYAPWCTHCKTLAPELSKAARELLKRDPPIRIAKVDATVDTGLAERCVI